MIVVINGIRYEIIADSQGNGYHVSATPVSK